MHGVQVGTDTQMFAKDTWFISLDVRTSKASLARRFKRRGKITESFAFEIAIIILIYFEEENEN